MYSEYTKQRVKEFVTNLGPAVVQAITNTGLFFPAVIGQLTMESEWGESDLSAKYNNFGGIKNTGSIYSSGKASLDTTEVINGKEIPVKQDFAAYPDFKNFMNDYVRVLALPHYVAAGVYSATSPYNQVLAMGKGGYSTRDPQLYADRAKGRIDACIDQFPWGKINSAAPAPVVEMQSSPFMSTIIGAITASLKPAS